ncbi:hypothetical protein ANO14919_137350 [Xylariales sp. No.14919]|nr:hypothetical protein ANO14919_137350 [Xylariales sp. No.14919]
MLRSRIVWTSRIFQAFFVSVIYGTAYYLPIYFQSINDASAFLSGVYLLPTILPQLIASASAGPISYVIPVALMATILNATGSGLYSLLQPASPIGWWVGFQITAGTIVAVQATVTEEQLTSATAFIDFSQSLGPAIFLSICNVIFVERLKSPIVKQAPGADVAAIVQAGATKFRTVVSSDDLPIVLVAYANSLDRVLYFIAAAVAVCAIPL